MDNKFMPQLKLPEFEPLYKEIEKRVLNPSDNLFINKLKQFSLKIFRPFFLANYRFTCNQNIFFDIADVRVAGKSFLYRHFSLLQFSAFVLLDSDKRALKPLVRMAALIVTAVRMHCVLKEHSPQAFQKEGENLNVDQYQNLFGCTLQTDKMGRLVQKHYKNSEHISVFFRGRAYLLKVINDKLPSDFHEILNGLKAICRADEIKDATHESAGPVSALRVKDYAKYRNNPNISPESKASFRAIEESLFAVCLDLDTENSDKSELCRSMHSKNIENRFFYLATQLIIDGKGNAGIILNFPAGIDGQIMLDFCKMMYQGSSQINIQDDTEDELPKIEVIRLPLKRMADIETKIPDIFHNAPYLFEFHGLGKTHFKNRKLSPDSTVHLALILATYKVFGKIPQVEQFVSMRKWDGGTLSRPLVTPSRTHEFIEVFQQNGFKEKKGYDLFLNVLQEHKKTITTAQQRGDAFASCVFSALHPLREKQSLLLFALFNLYLSVMNIAKSDIFSSHVKLTEGTAFIGRPGVMFTLTKMFSTHIFMSDDVTTFAIMPSPASLGKLDLLKKEIGQVLYQFLQDPQQNNSLNN